LEWKYHQKNLRRWHFYEDPARCKTAVHNKCLQEEKSFKYLSCEVSYGNEKDVQKQLATICSNTGNSKQYFSTNFGPEIIKNKSR
jgi:hypothetical protein